MPNADAVPLELSLLGPVPEKALGHLGVRLDRRLGTRTRHGPPLPSPPGLADGLPSAEVVDALLARGATGVFRLALVEAPLRAHDGAPVLGEAATGAGCACVSLPPLREGRGTNPAVFRRRLVTTAVHEVGHAAGLEHCPDPGCVMYPSQDIADTDRKGGAFCPPCRAKLNGRPEGDDPSPFPRNS